MADRRRAIGTGHVAKTFGLANALSKQQVEVLEEKLSTLCHAHAARLPSGCEIVCLRENPWIAQDAAADQDAFDPGVQTRNDLLRLDAIPAAEDRNPELLRDFSDQCPVCNAAVALSSRPAVHGDSCRAGVLDHPGERWCVALALIPARTHFDRDR